MKKLLHLDKVVYVRFASVFYRYQNIEAFKEELEKVILLRKVQNEE